MAKMDLLGRNLAFAKACLLAFALISLSSAEFGKSIHAQESSNPTAQQPASTPPTTPPAVFDVQPSLRVERVETIEDFADGLAILPTVFWEPLDTVSLRKRIRETNLVRNQTVLEIGTGSGLIALCCLKAGASSVVATDVNPSAIECAAYNARRLGLANLDLRKVRPGDMNAYTALQPHERFDLIITNPPWEDGTPQKIDDFALYDTKFALLDSILNQAKDHLRPNGSLYLAYGCKTAIKRMLAWADKNQWQSQVLDDRKLDDLTEVFLPGILVHLTPPKL